MFSNQLNDAQLERLAILSEEMGEAIQIVGKVLRHGYNSTNPKTGSLTTNRVLLQDELGHVLYAMRMLFDNDDICEASVVAQMGRKKRSIKPYLHHQRTV